MTYDEWKSLGLARTKSHNLRPHEAFMAGLFETFTVSGNVLYGISARGTNLQLLGLFTDEEKANSVALTLRMVNPR